MNEKLRTERMTRLINTVLESSGFEQCVVFLLRVRCPVHPYGEVVGGFLLDSQGGVVALSPVAIVLGVVRQNDGSPRFAGVFNLRIVPQDFQVECGLLTVDCLRHVSKRRGSTQQRLVLGLPKKSGKISAGYRCATEGILCSEDYRQKETYDEACGDGPIDEDRGVIHVRLSSCSGRQGVCCAHFPHRS